MKSHSIRHRSYLIPLLAIISCVAEAVPIFRVGSGGTQNWTQAGTQVRAIDPAEGFTVPEQNFYNQRVSDLGLNGFVRNQVRLSRDFNQPPSGPRGDLNLIASWVHPPDPRTLGVSSWQYTYNDDPDLSGLTVEFGPFAPSGVQDISITLIDMDGRARGWFQSEVDDDDDDWQEYVLDPEQGAQGPFDFFFDEAGFDLTRVISLRLNMSGYADVPFDDPDPTTGELTPWGAWNYLYVVPEPGSLLAILAGLAGLGIARGSRKVD